VTDSTENNNNNNKPPKPTRSRNPNSSAQIEVKANSQFEFVPRDTVKKFEFLDLVGFASVTILVDTVIRTH